MEIGAFGQSGEVAAFHVEVGTRPRLENVIVRPQPTEVQAAQDWISPTKDVIDNHANQVCLFDIFKVAIRHKIM